MAKQLVIHRTDTTIQIDGGDITTNVENGVLHVSVTGVTKRVRHGRQWSEDPQPDVTRSFPLMHVLEYQLTETD